MEHEFFVCECGSHEHQIILEWDPEGNKNVPLDLRFVEFTIHLSDHSGFLKRIIPAIRHVFGYKSKTGNFDEFILGANELDRMIERLQIARKDVFGGQKKQG